ncbi:MAG: S-methyl-5-thioribose-1-phosphate isomerase, partial [bacterium]|nr:S-methyl-5-thioribose-1-phosphate isomerase [bacterium]MDW8164116.1 S-methyl-5-thioribose-1-phosphate isomerase [Candidatus Omnitrophota bacterium]
MEKKPIKPLFWKNGLYVIDQTKLPKKKVILKLDSVYKVYNAIKELKIRGAPLIGCVCAYGVLVSFIENKNKSMEDLKKKIKEDIEFLKSSRPTAYNLFYSLNKMSKIVETFTGKDKNELMRRLLNEAKNIHNEDLYACYKIGKYGSKLIKDGMNILTHCNAGGLATTGFGTALAPIY